MGKEMTVTELKKQLSNKNDKELIKLLCQVYKGSDVAKKLLNMTLSGSEYEEKLVEQYKEKIYKEFFAGDGPTLSKAKAFISEFKKTGGRQEYVLDLQLYYVECGTEFTNQYGDIDERFYDSLCSVYRTVILAVSKQEELYQKFSDRLYRIVQDTGGIGWGFHDYLADEFYSIPWLQEDGPYFDN